MKPFSINELVKFLPKLKTTPTKALQIGGKRGLTKNYVVVLRTIMGYAEPRKRKFSEEEVKKICADYEKNPVTLREFAKKYNTSPSNIYQHLKKNGANIPTKNRFSKIENMRLEHLWKSGYSIKDIKAIMHRSHASIWARIKKMEAT